MHTTITAHQADKKFRKTYNAAAGGFAFILGLNTLVLLGIGAVQYNEPNPMFGPPGVLIGMGVALMGVTLGITAVIARKQRWGAVTGLVLIILLALAGFANFMVEAGEANSGGPGTPAPMCGLIIMFIIGMQLVRAIRAKPVTDYTPPAPAGYGATPYQPYGAGQPAPGQQPPAYAPGQPPHGAPAYPQQPSAGYMPNQPPPGYAPPAPYGSASPEPRESYTLGTVGVIFLAIGAFLFVGGSVGAVVSWVTETTVDQAAWQRVYDPELGVSLEMPGEPMIKPGAPVSGVSYEKTYTVNRHMYHVEMSCTRVGPSRYFDEEGIRGMLESQFDPEYVVSKSTTRTVVNGMSAIRVDYELRDDEVGVALGYFNESDAVIIAVNATSAVDDEVVNRVLNSLQRDR